jgi:hypothetical protein
VGEAPQANTTTRTERGPAPLAEAPSDWPTGRIQGTLVFTDAEDCRARVIGLADGREQPRGNVVGLCDLWAAPVGQRIAYSVAGTTGPNFAGWITFADLDEPDLRFRTYKHVVGDVLWSPDGRRAAWCEDSGMGLELEIGDARARRIARCPLAYTPDGRLASAVGRRLVVDGRTVLAQRDPITQAHWGDDESLLVVLAGGTVRRYDPDGGIASIGLFTDRDVVASPDNCAVLYEEPGRVHLADVGCFRGRALSAIAFDAAWSPDGEWVAVATPTQVEFHQVVGGGETLVWPARARELYWRGGD